MAEKTCHRCDGTGETWNGRWYEKCVLCNGTGTLPAEDRPAPRN